MEVKHKKTYSQNKGETQVQVLGAGLPIQVEPTMIADFLLLYFFGTCQKMKTTVTSLTFVKTQQKHIAFVDADDTSER